MPSLPPLSSLIASTFAGGAERLIVDASLALQQRGHAVEIFTSHHDPKHSFEETNNGENFAVVASSIHQEL